MKTQVEREAVASMLKKAFEHRVEAEVAREFYCIIKTDPYIELSEAIFVALCCWIPEDELLDYIVVVNASLMVTRKKT